MLRTRNNKIILTFIAIFAMISFANAQSLTGSFLQKKKPLLDVRIKKTGPYFGLQKGKYSVLEFGAEQQWKRITFGRNVTHAGHMGFNYNFRYNVLGYDVGYWMKPHAFGLTYGANLFMRSDFDRTKFGIAPVVGFKFWLLHLQTGYHLMSRPSDFETNTLFISMRIGIINDRDIDFKGRKKKNKKKKRKKDSFFSSK